MARGPAKKKPAKKKAKKKAAKKAAKKKPAKKPVKKKAAKKAAKKKPAKKPAKKKAAKKAAKKKPAKNPAKKPAKKAAKKAAKKPAKKPAGKAEAEPEILFEEEPVHDGSTGSAAAPAAGGAPKTAEQPEPAEPQEPTRPELVLPPVDPDIVLKLLDYLDVAGSADAEALNQGIEFLDVGIVEAASATAEAVTLLRGRGKVDYLLQAAGGPVVSELPEEQRDLARLAALRSLGGEAALELAARLDADGKAVEAALTRLAADGEESIDFPDRAKNTVSYLAARYSLPHWLAAEILAEHGLQRAEVIGQGSAQDALPALAVNRIRTDTDALAERLIGEGMNPRPSKFARDCLVVDPDADLFGTRSYEEGLFEVVGQADQIAAQLAVSRERGTAIYLQAGPGALHDAVLASSQQNRDKLTVLASDIGASLGAKKRARRLGSVMVRVLEVAADEPLDVERIGTAERVLVEVPSTGTGTMLRDPLARWKLDPTTPEELQARQIALLDRAAALVAPGGRLVYVCHSVLYRENQAVLAEFLGAHPEFGRFAVRHVHPALSAFETNEDFLQILPGQESMDGLFAAALERE